MPIAVNRSVPTLRGALTLNQKRRNEVQRGRKRPMHSEAAGRRWGVVHTAWQSAVRKFCQGCIVTPSIHCQHLVRKKTTTTEITLIATNFSWLLRQGNDNRQSSRSISGVPDASEQGCDVG